MGLLGWGEEERRPGQDPYASSRSTYMDPGQSGTQRVGNFITDELLGFDDFSRAATAWRQGDLKQLGKSVGMGLFELGTTIAPIGAAAKLARAVPLARSAMRIGAAAPAPVRAVGRAAFGTAPVSGAQSALRRGAEWTGRNVAPFGAAVALEGPVDRRTVASQAARERASLGAQAQRYQGIADRFARQQATPPSQMGSWERAITGGGGGSQGQSIRERMGVSQPSTPSQQEQVANQFSRTLRGLTPSQEEYFTQMAMDAERRRVAGLGDIDEQEAEARRRAALSARNIAARGAGSLADLRAAAGQAGMLMSPASYEVGREFEAGQTAAGLASQRAALDQFLSQAERGRSDIAAGYRQFMDDVRRQRLAQQKENEMMWAQQLMDTLGQYGFPSGG